MTDASPRPADGRLWPIGLLLLATAVYLNALWNGFALDDVRVIQENPAIHDLGRIRTLLTAPYWPGTQELYRPLTMFTLAVDWAVSGGAPWWFHLVNVVLHALATLLVFRLLRALEAEPAFAGGGAAVFAVHPVHVEAVANVVGRSELLAAILVLGACLVHLRSRRRGVVHAAWMSGAYFLALGAKEIALTLPALLLLLDLFRDRSRPRQALWDLRFVWLGQGLALLGFLGLRRLVTGTPLGASPAAYLEGLSTADRVATALRLWPEYVRLLFWPTDLASEWGPPMVPVVGWSDPGVWASAALVAGLLAAAWLSWRRGSGWAALGIAWFAIVILPVSQLLFAIGTLLAERTLYLPSVGLALAFPALEPLRRLARPPVPQGALAAVLLVGAFLTWDRTPVWRTTETVRDDLIARHPESWRVQWDMADVYAGIGDTTRARESFRKVLEYTRENDARILVSAARFELRMGDTWAAEQLVEKALRRAPGDERALMLRALTLLLQGRDSETVRFADSVRVAGASPALRQWMHHYAALALDAGGDRPGALERSHRALAEGQPWGRPVVWMLQARLQALAGDSSRARAALDSAGVRIPLSAAVTLDPRSPELGGIGPRLRHRPF